MKAGRLVFRYTDLTLVERYAYSKRSLRYFFRTSDSGRSLEVEDIYHIYRLLLAELYRVGRLTDPKKASRLYEHTHRRNRNDYLKGWQERNPEAVIRYRRQTYLNRKLKAGKITPEELNELASIRLNKRTPNKPAVPMPLLATHEIQQGQIKRTV